MDMADIGGTTATRGATTLVSGMVTTGVITTETITITIITIITIITMAVMDRAPIQMVL
jgi:hypothetical protein